MKNKSIIFVLLFCTGLFCTRGLQALADVLQTPQAFAPDVLYTFTPVPEGAKIIHEFVVKNKGNGLLHIRRVKTG